MQRIGAWLVAVVLVIIAAKKLENDMPGSPAVPCGFDQPGRPVGLQIAAPSRREEVAFQATGLDRLLPIDSMPWVVPPCEA